MQDVHYILTFVSVLEVFGIIQLHKQTGLFFYFYRATLC